MLWKKNQKLLKNNFLCQFMNKKISELKLIIWTWTVFLVWHNKKNAFVKAKKKLVWASRVFYYY